MAYTITPDIQRMLETGAREVFMENMNAWPKEFDAYCESKPTSIDEEKYDSMGNIANGGELPEGDDISYNKIQQAYQTKIKTKQWANGFSVSYKAQKLDLYGVINNAGHKDLARTASEDKENAAIYWINNLTAVNLADGVPAVSTSHPLINSAALIDNTQTAASIAQPDSHKTMFQAFKRGWKNHAGGKMRCNPTDALTNAINQWDVEAVYESILKPKEMSNTKNTLPKLNWHYSSFMSSETAWVVWDAQYEKPVIYQSVQEEEYHMEIDKIKNYNLYFNYLALFNTGMKVPVGLFYNAGV